MQEFKIIKDTREQKGWNFLPDQKPKNPKCLGMVSKKLDCGDYSVQGLEDLCVIERKVGFTELINNMTPKSSKVRFEKEMDKMLPITYKYILVETNLTQDLIKSSTPQSRVPYKVVLDWIFDINLKYGVNVMFVGDCGEEVALRLFRKIVEKNV